MNCTKYIEWIALKLEGSLPEPESEELDVHLQSCSRCRAELQLQRNLVAALREEPSFELSAGFTEQVVEMATALSLARRRLPVWVLFLPVAVLLAGAITLSVVWAEQLRVLLEALRLGGWVSSAGTWVAATTEKVLARVGDIPSLSVPAAMPELGVAEKLLLTSLLSSVPVIWCFYQVYAFLRE